MVPKKTDFFGNHEKKILHEIHLLKTIIIRYGRTGDLTSDSYVYTGYRYSSISGDDVFLSGENQSVVNKSIQ